MSIVELNAVADELEQLIAATVPGTSRVAKYGGVLYTLEPEQKEAQFCGVFVYKEHVQLSFSQGVRLNDPSGLLQGSGKRRRHVNVRRASDIDREATTKLLLQAAALNA